MSDLQRRDQFKIRRSTMSMRFCALIFSMNVGHALDMGGLPDIGPVAGLDIGAGMTRVPGKGWAALAEYHCVFLAFNGSVETVKYLENDDFHLNSYIGLGVGPALQIQRGFEEAEGERNRGSTRIRSQINISHIINGNTKDRHYLLSCFFFSDTKNLPSITLSPYCELYDKDLSPSQWRLGVNLGMCIPLEWFG